MEIMSANTPMFVLDSNCHWAFGSIWSPFPATSVPHWYDKCGMVLHEKNYTKEYVEAYKPSCNSKSKNGRERLTSWRKKTSKKTSKDARPHKPTQGKTPRMEYIFEQFDLFLNSLNSKKYYPRKYILKEHSLEKSVENLIKIFEKYK